MNTGKVDVLLGLQWGDEGKGKVVDVLTPKYDVIARFQGGPNAGHTLEFEGEKYVLRSIPSGIFQGGKVNIIGNGVVLAPDLFMGEAKDLEKSGHDLKSRLFISKKAHLIMPTHRVLDAAIEASKGKNKVGTTGKGIGPTYTDKVSRTGLRVGDILDNFEEKYAAHKAAHLKTIGNVYGIMKAYCTRVGAGPFPTELFDETGAKIRDLGHEYGAVTGRERRCGWCDLVQLKYSVMVNGVTELIMMKSDVLDGFDTIKACVAYKLKDGSVTTDFPYEIDDVEPVYKEFKGWKTDMTQFTSEDQFPQEFKDYIAFIEEFLETKIGIISIGPDRAQTIVRK